MNFDVKTFLALLAWLIPRVLDNVSILQMLASMADKDNAAPQVRAFLRARIAERQALAEAEAQK